MRYIERQKLNTIRKISRYAFTLVSCAAILMLSGCGGGFHGTSTDTYPDGSHEIVKINENGTYDQTITCGSGKTITQHQKWRETNGAEANIPEVQNSQSYIVLEKKYDLHDYCGQNMTAAPPQITSEEPKMEFQVPESERRDEQSSIVGLTIFFRIAFFIFWLAMVVDVCRRDFRNANTKVGWVLCVVLLYCLGALIYLIFGRTSDQLPKAEAE